MYIMSLLKKLKRIGVGRSTPTEVYSQETVTANTEATTTGDSFQISQEQYGSFRAMAERVSKSAKALDEAEKNSIKTREIAEKNQNLVILGFIVMLTMVAGLI